MQKSYSVENITLSTLSDSDSNQASNHMKTKKELSPLHDNMLCEEMLGPDKHGAIIVPEAHRTILNQGRVLEKGPHCSDVVDIGDVVFFPQHTENRTGALDGKKYLLIAESNCLGKIKTTEIPE